MGMRQKRCPVCKKRRPYRDSGNRKPNQVWTTVRIDGKELFVCYWCIPKVDAEPAETAAEAPPNSIPTQ